MGLNSFSVTLFRHKGRWLAICNAASLLCSYSVAYAEDIKDVRPPVGLPLNIFLVLVCVLLLIGVVAVALVWYRHKKKRRKTVKAGEPLKTAWQIAFEELERLKREELIGLGRYKEYYSQLSDIVRAYFEARFKIRAPEMTTEEFLVSLRDCGFLKEAQKHTLQEFLHASDMVKFAKYAPTVDEAESSFSLASRLIEETIPAQEATVEGGSNGI